MAQKQFDDGNSASPLIRKADGLYYTATKLSFRITGLKPHNLDRLRVTLKASPTDKPDQFHSSTGSLYHIDSLDLYNSRSREAFCESCRRYLKVKPETTAAELTELIKVLEHERIAMRELGKTVFPRNVDDVSPTGRTLLGLIDDYVHEKYRMIRGKEPESNEELASIPFSRKELRERSGWSEKQIRANIEPLVELGYLSRVGHSRQGSAYRYILLDNGKDDPQLEL